MNISFRQVFAGFSVAFLVPLTLAHGHVFYCPPGEKITLEQQEKRHWAAPVQQAPEGTPYFFKTLRYTAESIVEEMGSRDHHDEVINPEVDPDLQFKSAYYRTRDGFSYGCIYTDKKATDVEIVLAFDEVKVPGSQSPLWVEPHGVEWKRTQDERCKKKNSLWFQNSQDRCAA